MKFSPTVTRIAPTLIALVVLGSAAAAQERNFAETFALATDRAAVLDQLIPGTPEYYYYNCLERQAAGAFDEVDELLRLWIERYGRNDATGEIENRQALFAFERDPAQTYAFLARRLGLRFDHERALGGPPAALPARLDPALLDPAALMRRALGRDPETLDGFRDSALEGLAATPLSPARLRVLLSRLRRPDVPGLAQLVVRDLAQPRSRGFGSLAIHGLLTLEQLDACAGLDPRLLESDPFVDAYLARLRPNDDVHWRDDPAAREAYLERLQRFAERLSPAQNSLKAHVLHHRLASDWAAGRPDEQRLLDYLRLPRRAAYVREAYLRGVPGRDTVDAGRAFSTGLEPVGDDERLVRAYLLHFLAPADDYARYSELLDERYVRRLFAESKILAGVGDMERWYSLLDDPTYYEALRDRVELEFAPTQPEHYDAAEPVAVEVDVKNVRTLLVKVFEIDAFNYYREQDREVDASIDLDGLVANHETSYTLDESPLRRKRMRFDLPQLARPGVYVVELIGNGISSRAVIHKGSLQVRSRRGSAGRVLRVCDERGATLSDASVWFGGRDWPADEHGEIVLPFSAEPGLRTVVLRHGEFAARDQVELLGEQYRLTAGIFLERESLLAGGIARLLLRPTVLANGVPVSLAVLEQPELVVTATDVRGTPSVLEVPNFALDPDGETVRELRVPPNARELHVQVRGRVQPLTDSEPRTLESDVRTFPLNGIDATPLTACPLLGRSADGYFLDLLGKSGEPRAGVPLALTLELRDYTEDLRVSLQTDAAGRIRLGPLSGVRAVSSSGFPGNGLTWRLEREQRTYPARIQGPAGATLRVPYPGPETRVSRSAFGLLETRDGRYVRDAFAALRLDGGELELRDLEPGDYELWLKGPAQRIDVRIGRGPVEDGWVRGRDRRLEVTGTALGIADVLLDDEGLTVRLTDFGPTTRVHVAVTRYLPAYDPFEHLLAPAGRTPGAVDVRRARASYHSGRAIGDEYRYILERRLAAKFPGNMLVRPGLLLNPWALEETTSHVGAGGGAGGKFGSAAGAPGAPGRGDTVPPRPQPRLDPGSFANLEFLPHPSVLLANLRPDDEGVVRVPRAELGDGSLVHVLALDAHSTVYTTLARPEQPLQPVDRRLAESLAADRHLLQRQTIEFVDAAGEVALDAGAQTQLEVFDSLAAVYRFLRTQLRDPGLAEFEFLVRWPELSREEQLRLYSAHACHELHLFLQQRDPAFFDEVVRPYLANKAEPTFMDHWLLGDDLTAYLDPWAFAQLNVVERILLTHRVGDAAAGTRHVNELLELAPPDPDWVRGLFAAALRGGALEGQSPAEAELGRLLAAQVPRESLRGRDEFFLGQAEAPVAKARASQLADVAEAERDLDRRGAIRNFYRAPDATRAYVESDYWHLRRADTTPELIPVNQFWADFARTGPDRPFSSPHFPQASGSVTEALLALALLDLPFAAEEHTTQAAGARLRFTAGSPLLLVREQLADAAPADDPVPLLMRERFLRLDDRTRLEAGRPRERFVTGEFLTGVAYAGQVVVTNPSAEPLELDLLLQIPAGAVPVQQGFRTHGQHLRLEGYRTQTVEYAFYFPAPGTFAHYPAQAAVEGRNVAAAEPRSLLVRREPSEVDTGSWQHVSQLGTGAEVLAYLDGANLQATDLSAIAWRMRDRAFFGQVLERLRRRHVYQPLLWSYGIHHRDARATAEYLRNETAFVGACGAWLDTPLLRIDPVERKAYEQIEFRPLIHPRAHPFAGRREILDQDVARQYASLLHLLAYRPGLDDEDWMTVTYYLLLQDRVGEALESFARVDPAALRTHLQYDYLRAYLDFFSADHAAARGIAEGYRDYPVERWRELFGEVLSQVDEAAGRGESGGGAGGQDALVRAEPTLELAVEARRVALGYQNLARCEVRYYAMDIESLFSTNPFVQQDSSSFAYVRPNRVDAVELPADRSEYAFDLPTEFQSANVLVEVHGGGLVRRQAYFSNALELRIQEAYGRLQVLEVDSGRPLQAVYVKVFARGEDGAVRFHKDGYTDLRGRFDYASLTGASDLPAERFAVLVLSDDHGASIRELQPPQR